MATPHNEASIGDIAKVVLMPGDPNRAKWIAETYLHDVKCVNTVRCAFCYTGLTKNNKRISVMPSGMGHASIGIYSYELFNEYNVDAIIRVGTCGAYQNNINFRDVLLAAGSSTDSNYAAQFRLDGHFSALADMDLMFAAKEILDRKKVPYHMGNVLSADVFYDFDQEVWKKWAKLGVMAVEMESYALYINAHYLGKKALTMLTVSDHFTKGGRLSPEERKSGLSTMVEVAVEVAEKFAE